MQIYKLTLVLTFLNSTGSYAHKLSTSRASNEVIVVVIVIIIIIVVVVIVVIVVVYI